MAGWTKTNLRDVKDVAEDAGLAPASRPASHARTWPRSGSGSASSGSHPARANRSAIGTTEDEEIYVVVSGAGRVKLDDEFVALAQWDAIRVAPETMRCFEAGPEGLEYVGFGTHTENDTAPVPGWWAD